MAKTMPTTMNRQKSGATTVFVYGTLKGMHIGNFVDHAVTEQLFELYGGGFPVAVPADEPSPTTGYIRGEVYIVNDSEKAYLDSYEGYPNLYGREQYLVSLHGGGSIAAWVYTGNQIKAHLASRPQITADDEGVLSWPFAEQLPIPASSQKSA